MGRAFSATDELPPPDSMVGYVMFEDGTPANVSFSFSAAQVNHQCGRATQGLEVDGV